MNDSWQHQPVPGTAWSQYGRQDLDLQQAYRQQPSGQQLYAPYAQQPYAQQPDAQQPYAQQTRTFAQPPLVAQQQPYSPPAPPSYGPPNQGPPNGWGAPPPAASPAKGNRNVLIVILAVVVIAATAVVIILATKKSPANQAGQQVPVDTSSAAGNPGGARPFPEPASSTDSPGAQAPSTQEPTAQAPTTAQVPVGDGGSGSAQDAAYASAKAFAEAVDAHSLSGVMALECRALAAGETQRDIDSITRMTITGPPVVDGQKALVEVYITDETASGTAHINMVVEDQVWKMCKK